MCVARRRGIATFVPPGEDLPISLAALPRRLSLPVVNVAMSFSPRSDALSAVVAVYVLTQDYHRTLERRRARTISELDQWASVVDAALSALGDRVAHETEQHRIWPWIADRVQADRIVTGRLLAKLDPALARSPASFWRFCGLATVPGVAMICDKCAHTIQRASAAPLACSRSVGSPPRRCGGRCRPDARPGSRAFRIAQRWMPAARGGRVPYDPEARKAAYLLGHDLLARSSYYGEFYEAELRRLAINRPRWTHHHQLRAARRRMTKAFLRDLWHAWRLAEGLSTESVPRRLAPRQPSTT